MSSKELSRRNFISNATMATIGTIGAANLLSSCSSKKAEKAMIEPFVIPDKAPDGKVLKAGLIGCGGRGTGAAINFLDAGPNLEIVALGDVFRDRIDQCRAELKKQKNVEIPEEKCFVGFDNYEKVLDSGIDIVLLCTPPHFRPQHIEAAVKAGKHIFHGKACCRRSGRRTKCNGECGKSKTAGDQHGQRNHPPCAEGFHGNMEAGSEWNHRRHCRR